MQARNSSRYRPSTRQGRYNKYRLFRPKHTQPSYSLFLLDYVIENRHYRAKKSTLILIQPYAYHYFTIKSNTNYEKIGILFNPSSLKIDSTLINPHLEILDCNHYAILDSIFQKLSYYYKSFPEKTFISLFLPLIKEIIFNLSLIKEPSITPQYHTPILSPVLEYINNNLYSISRIEDISQALNISASYLKAVFKKELKIQPKKYINEKKLLNAYQLILSGEKATVASEKCGFYNYSTFYRLYRDYFGFSPSKDTLKNE